MDLDYSKKVTLILFLDKLIKFPLPHFVLGSIHYDIAANKTYIYIGNGQWRRV